MAMGQSGTSLPGCVCVGGCYPPIIKMFVKMEISWSNKLAAVKIFRLFLVSVSSGKFLVIMGPEIFYVIIMVCMAEIFGDLPLPQTIYKHNQAPLINIIKVIKLPPTPKKFGIFLKPLRKINFCAKRSEKNTILLPTIKKLYIFWPPFRKTHP